MFIPDRPIESDPAYQAMWGDADLCSKCETELRNLHDEGHAYLVCPKCDLGEPEKKDVLFNLHFYGMRECQSFENGIVEDSRDEMFDLQMWWEENLDWKLSQIVNDIHELADVREGNPAGQYFIWWRGYQIGCVTEIFDGPR